MERYNSINGLRTIACIGIVLMHVLANINYGLNNEIITNIIKSFTHFVYLFMIISAFSMCCGYYDKIKNNKISMNEFYKKRFTKILPFFSILIILNILMERNISAIFEGFADLTLLFGFLPVNKLSAIGVAWFLGVVFIFYIIFPFFVFLFDNKKRAWIIFVIALILNILCSKYFFTETFGLINYTNRHNFLYDFAYFCTGGLIYLYREKIKKLVSKNYSLVLIITFLFTISYFFIPENDYLFTIQMIIIFSLWIFTAMKENNILLNNKITSFISQISLEIYLSHMVIFRIIEKLHLTKIFTNNYLSYIIVSIIVIALTITTSYLFSKLLANINNHKFKIDNINQ